MLDHGHTEARRYPIGMVLDEAEIVVERLDRLAAQNATLTQMAVASLFSKEGGKQFSKMIKRYAGDG